MPKKGVKRIQFNCSRIIACQPFDFRRSTFDFSHILFCFCLFVKAVFPETEAVF